MGRFPHFLVRLIRDLVEPPAPCRYLNHLTRCETMAKRASLKTVKAVGRRAPVGRWKLEDAKARFSEVVRHVRENGPQRVTVRGHDAVVVMSVEEFERLMPEKPRAPFVEFMESLHLSGLEHDKGIRILADDHTDRPRYIAARDALEARFGERILSLTDEVVRRWGRLAGEVKRASGHPPQVIDTMLATTAIEHDLVTRTVKDARPSGALIVDPWNNDPAKLPLCARTRRAS
jgi:prevent-host-death family protein